MDTSTQTAIQRLAKSRPAVEPLGNPPVMDPLPVTVSLGRDNTARATGGEGIASPLSETTRTVYSTQSSDGLFVWSVPATITFHDARGREVVMEFDQP